MNVDFYKEWLNIPEDQRPPNNYQLLGITPFTSEKETIEQAARDRARLLKGYELGTHSAQSQTLLTEIARARADLLNPKRKAEYDKRLRAGEKAPQLEVDSLEMFKNLVAFSMPRGNLSKEHIASLLAEAGRLKVPQEQAKAIIQPLFLQAKKRLEELTAAKEEERRKKEMEERAAQRKAAMRKVLVGVIVLALVGVGALFLLKFKTASEEKKKVELVEKKEQQARNESEELLAKAKAAERQRSWQQAAELYEKAVSLSGDEGAKKKLAAMREVLGAIKLEAERKWADAAASYKKAGEALKDPALFSEKLTSLGLAQRYEQAYAEGAAKEKEKKPAEACAAFEKALGLAKEAKLDTDADKRIEAIRALLGQQAGKVAVARRLLDACSAQEGYSALLAAANFYLAQQGPAELRPLAEQGKATAEAKLKEKAAEEKRKPEEILTSCAVLIQEGKCYRALKEIGRLQYGFAKDRVCTDEAYQAEIAGKAAKDAPKTLKEMLSRCVEFGESMCPECMGTGRLPCRLCEDTGTIEKRCDVCNGLGTVRGCDECLSTGFVLGPCLECKGTGRWKCDKCRGRGCKFCGNNPKRPCTHCKGTGRAPTAKRCPACNGKGKIGDAECAKCKGKGKPLCPVCEGTCRKPCEKCKGAGKTGAPCPKCSKGSFRRCAVCGGAGKVKNK